MTLSVRNMDDERGAVLTKSAKAWTHRVRRPPFWLIVTALDRNRYLPVTFIRSMFHPLTHMICICIRSAFHPLIHLICACTRSAFHPLIHLSCTSIRSVFHPLIHLICTCIRSVSPTHWFIVSESPQLVLTITKCGPSTSHTQLLQYPL